MNFIDQITNLIIRPPRDKYRLSRLGSKKFSIITKTNKKKLNIYREDSSLLTYDKQKIELSYFHIEDREKQRKPCVIYLHGNSGSRNQGIMYAKSILERQMEVAVFDFLGSGQSEGEYVTLGINESRNIEIVVQHILKYKNVNDIFLWGRSMGAVASLIYISENPYKIQAAVFDSPFSSLNKLICELGNQKTHIPQFLLSSLVPFINRQIQNKVKISIRDLQILQYVGKIQSCSGLFITSKKDKLVDSRHTEQLFQAYNGAKELHYIPQQHHQLRSEELTNKILQFFCCNCIGNNIGKVNAMSFIEMLDDCRQTDVEVPSKIPNANNNKISLSELLRKNPYQQQKSEDQTSNFNYFYKDSK